MAEECIAAVYDSVHKAQEAVHILDRAEFPSDQISLVTTGLKEQPELVQELEMGDDSLRDAAIGGGLGTVVGMLAGLGCVVVSGVGIFLVGPLAAVGGITGAFLGGIAGWGVHTEHIHHYEKLVKQGKVLVIAHGDPLELVQAERILAETDVSELHVHAKTGDDSPEIVGK